MITYSVRSLTHFIDFLPLKSRKPGRFKKLLDFARSHFIMTRGLVSLSRATAPHPSCLIFR